VKNAEQGDFKVIISSYLSEDKRILKPPVAKKRIFESEFYEIQLAVYAGIPKQAAYIRDLGTALVCYKREKIQLLVRIATYARVADPAEHIERQVQEYNDAGKSPLELVRQAKEWCNLPLTHNDLWILNQAGIVAA
jgi:hypothetical protein